MYCSNCGSNISSESKYCSKCGSSVDLPSSNVSIEKNIENKSTELRAKPTSSILGWVAFVSVFVILYYVLGIGQGDIVMAGVVGGISGLAYILASKITLTTEEPKD